MLGLAKGLHWRFPEHQALALAEEGTGVVWEVLAGAAGAAWGAKQEL